MDAKAFGAFVERFPTPTPKRGRIVMMDNLSMHMDSRVRGLFEEAGATLLFLPLYSPNMNPKKEAFSKLKNILRRRPLGRGRSL